MNNLSEEFGIIFSQKPEFLVKAPGRVNLIGEHTDYNGGFVLPIAINKFIFMAASKRKDNLLSIYSLNYNQKFEISLDKIKFSKNKTWVNYLQGIAKILQSEKFKLRGANILCWGDIPQGSGLSSSAALEVATILAFQKINRFKLDKLSLALICQKAENKFVGVNCGIMDQFISLLAKKNHALFIDCQNLKYQAIPINLKDYKLVITNSKINRKLTASLFNQRRKECEEGLKIFKKFLPKIKTLRNIIPSEFEEYKNYLPAVIRKRLLHVIYENQRVLESILALKNNDLKKFGILMNQSHLSLKENYKVSSPALDTLVETAWKTKGVLGSRLTGAGFGGCTISLVKEKFIPDFKEKLSLVYQKKFKISPEFYETSPEEGAKVL